MKYFSKKVIVLVFLALAVFSMMPKTTSAAVPTYETNPVLTKKQPLDNSITSIFQKAENIEQLLEFAAKLAAESLKRQLLNMIVDQIVAYIQGGGTPKFITDWPGFLQDAVDQAGGQFLQDIGAGQLCDAFRVQLSAAFIPIPKFSDRSACTLSQVGVNLQDFLNNFENGGWVAWQQMTLNPQNNIYGAYIMGWDEQIVRRSAAAKAAQSEAQAGRGFLSVRRCLESVVDEDGTERCSQSEIITPGAAVADIVGKAVGSDIDYIVNAQDFEVYTAAIANAILNRIFAEGVGLLHSALSSSGGGGGGGGGSAAQTCAPFLGTPAYTDCVNAVQSGQDVREFQKTNLIKNIDLDLGFQNQLLGAKQSTLVVLNQSLDILNQLETCQKSPSPSAAAVKSDIGAITGQIAGIQSDIVALQLKQQQIKAVTDLTQIPSLYAEVAGTVNPAATQSLALAAQNETSDKQKSLLFYQQQLDSCLVQQQQQSQTQSNP